MTDSGRESLGIFRRRCRLPDRDDTPAGSTRSMLRPADEHPCRSRIGKGARYDDFDLGPGEPMTDPSYGEPPPPATRTILRPSAVGLRREYRAGRTYTVAEGETLFTIARYELGKASRWVEIYELNRHALATDSTICGPARGCCCPSTNGPRCSPSRLAASIGDSGIGPMKIVSGGQTGVDRGALDAAIELAIPHGGWCPRGRLAEDGPIPEQYGLIETDSPDYPSRTQRNVVESDATLILFRGRIAGGTELTFRLAEEHQRPRLAGRSRRRGRSGRGPPLAGRATDRGAQRRRPAREPEPRHRGLGAGVPGGGASRVRSAKPRGSYASILLQALMLSRASEDSASYRSAQALRNRRSSGRCWTRQWCRIAVRLQFPRNCPHAKQRECVVGQHRPPGKECQSREGLATTARGRSMTRIELRRGYPCP